MTRAEDSSPIHANDLRHALFVSLWFCLLTFPLLVVKVNPITKMVFWRWPSLLWVWGGSFAVVLAGRLFSRRKRGRIVATAEESALTLRLQRLRDQPVFRKTGVALLGLAALVFPLMLSAYQTNVMTTALLYVVLGLGLNIVVGLAGLLDLGYVAFYAVGAYSYALLNRHFGLGFWEVLPLGAGLAALFGILLGFPVLRLRGDYLAIVTLGFGEIIRLILENWGAFSGGPSGVMNIPRPSFFGLSLSLQGASTAMYYLMLLLVLCTVFVVRRLADSRIGRAWLALREDEIACQAMGIDKTRTKLTAFALGATWAGMAGVVFAAKTTFINPASFTFWESAIILAIVVLGGMGSVAGVVIAALILLLLPEYLRDFAQFRMILFGAVMVLMMRFRPQGLFSAKRSQYFVDTDNRADPDARRTGETP